MGSSFITAERPFGIHFYSLFEKAYHLLTDRRASAFRFINGYTPFSTNTEVLLSCILYFVVIFGGQQIMKNLSPFRFQRLFQLHNLLLTIVSGILLVLIVEQIFPKVYHHGFLYAICNPRGWTQELELLYYLNYLVKYWELLDTVFLVVKKKKLEFLHYYHHSLTMILCYVQLNGKTTVSWVPIALNLFVHVLMYYYYFCTAAGAKIWWKKYLTTLQITQFIIDLTIVYFCTYTYFAYTYYPSLPNMGDCAGTETSALFGCALLSSYLVLFINFYRLTYKQKRNSREAIKATMDTTIDPVSSNNNSPAIKSDRVTRSVAAKKKSKKH